MMYSKNDDELDDIMKRIEAKEPLRMVSPEEITNKDDLLFTPQYNLRRRAPISGSKKATKTGKSSISLKLIITCTIVVIMTFVCATLYNNAKADLLSEKLPGVKNVGWFDDFEAYDGYGNRVTGLSSEEWEEAMPSWSEIVEEMLHNNITQDWNNNRGGR